MNKGFSKLDNPSHEGNTNTWLTPKSILDPLGWFDLDPCAERGWETAKNYYYDQGLEKPWFGRVWLNPPYGKNTGKWLSRLQEHGNGIALVFARTDTKWFQAIKPHAIRFIAGRIAFLKPDHTASTNAGAPSCLIAYGQKNVASIENINGVTFQLAEIC